MAGRVVGCISGIGKAWPAAVVIASGISQVADTTREKYLPELQAGIFGVGSTLNNPAQSRRAVFLGSGLVRFCFCPGLFHLLSGRVVTALDFAFRPGKTVESEPCIAQLKNCPIRPLLTGC